MGEMGERGRGRGGRAVERQAVVLREAREVVAHHAAGGLGGGERAGLSMANECRAPLWRRYAPTAEGAATRGEEQQNSRAQHLRDCHYPARKAIDCKNCRFHGCANKSGREALSVQAMPNASDSLAADAYLAACAELHEPVDRQVEQSLQSRTRLMLDDLELVRSRPLCL